MTGPTKNAVDFRINYTSDACDSFAEAFTDQGGGQYSLDGECNPWSGGGCATATSICSRQIFMIPIVDDFGNGSSDPSTVISFALVFLEGYDSGKCQGSSCEIKARFVRADVNTESLAGSYDEDSAIHFVHLIE
jgi:hypothetical protein